MFALMEMTNPMWEWLIAPLILIGIGMLLGGVIAKKLFDYELNQGWRENYIDNKPPLTHVKFIPDSGNTLYNWEDEEGFPNE